MGTAGTFLGVLSFGVFIWAVVGAVKPTRARLDSRRSAVVVWIGSCSSSSPYNSQTSARLIARGGVDPWQVRIGCE